MTEAARGRRGATRANPPGMMARAARDVKAASANAGAMTEAARAHPVAMTAALVAASVVRAQVAKPAAPTVPVARDVKAASAARRAINGADSAVTTDVISTAANAAQPRCHYRRFPPR